MFYNKILVFLTLLLSLSFSFSTFTIHNSNLDETSVFSFNDLDFYISSTKNDSVLLTYTLTSNNVSTDYNKTLFLLPCSVNSLSTFCIKDSFSNYIETTNLSFSSAISFDFSQSSTKKSISLDLLKPEVNTTVEFNKTLKSILYTISISDNMDNNVDSSIEIFVVNDNTSTLVHTEKLKKQNVESSYDLTQGGTYIFKVSATDDAGNNEFVEKGISVGDIFPPVISNFTYVEDENLQKSLRFKLKDENQVVSWELESSNRVYGEIFQNNRSSHTVETAYVFTTGDSIILSAEDSEGNSQKVSFSKPSIITISANEEFSNLLQITTKNAKECRVIKGFSKVYDLKKNDKFFTTYLDLEKEGDYEIIVKCSNSNYEKTQKLEFTIDKTAPKITNFNVSKEGDGSIKLSFNYSNDAHKIEIFRDKDRIERFDGDDNEYEYIDYDVSFPEEYGYFIKVIDMMNNDRNSEKIEITPLKANLDFNVNVVDNDEFVIVEIYGEKNLKGKIKDSKSIILSNKQNIKFSRDLFGDQAFILTDPYATFYIKKTNKSQSYVIEVSDDFENSKSEKISILKLPQPMVPLAVVEEVKKNNTKKEITEILTEEIDEPTKLKFIWFIVLILLIVFIIFLVKLDNNHPVKRTIHKSLPKRKEKKSNKEKNKKLEKKNSKSFLQSVFSKKKGTVQFDKEIEKRLEDKRQKEIEEELKRKKVLQRKKQKMFDKKSEYEKNKIYDLNKGNKNAMKDFTNKKKEEIKESKKNNKESSNKNKKVKKDKVFSYSHSMFDNFMSRIVHKEKHSTKEIKNFELKEVDKTRKDIFSESDISKFTNKEKNKKKEMTPEKKEIPKKEIKPDPVVEDLKKEEKHGVEWGDYLQKRSKSRNWFMTQRDVEKDIKGKK